MRIAEIRRAIESLNWSRHANTGGTPEENRRTDLAGMLGKHIAIVEALEIPPRFAKDIQDRADALKYANVAIERWKLSRFKHGESFKPATTTP